MRARLASTARPAQFLARRWLPFSHHGKFPLVSRFGKCDSWAVRIIARRTILAYITKHPLTRASLTHWIEVTENAEWSSTSEVIADFSKAKTVTAERIRFEVAGGDHRMIVAFHFRRGIAFIKFIGTHGAYDRIDAATVDQF